MKQNNLVSEQFSSSVQAYLKSSVHANGTDLQRLTQLTRDSACYQALDLGCGAGHAAFAMAKAGSAVIAYDLSPKMLALVEREAIQRCLTNITTHLGVAEILPFADASFDLVVTRFSAHHWCNVPAALAEVKRVLKSTGTLLVIDVVAAENPLFDTVLQTVEILGDPSHIRDYRVSEWQSMLHGASFDVIENDRWSLPVEFASWSGIKRTSKQRIQAIQDVFDYASDEVRQHFKLQPDYAFDLEIAWLQASPAFKVS